MRAGALASCLVPMARPRHHQPPPSSPTQTQAGTLAFHLNGLATSSPAPTPHLPPKCEPAHLHLVPRACHPPPPLISHPNASRVDPHWHICHPPATHVHPTATCATSIDVHIVFVWLQGSLMSGRIHRPPSHSLDEREGSDIVCAAPKSPHKHARHVD